MRTKPFTILSLFAVLALVAVFLSGCASSVRAAQPDPTSEATPSNPTAQPAPVTPRTISVNGSADVFLRPDIAYITVGVHTEAENAVEAVASNNTQAQQVLDALLRMGIDEDDIRTNNFSIYPSQRYNPQGELQGTIYMVDNTVHVTLRNLDQVGETLDAAVSAGANSIHGIQFDVENKEDALSEARSAAVANARMQAEELAAAAGVTLGAIQNMSYYGGSPTPVYYESARMAQDMAGGVVPIATGQLTLTANVSIVFEIH